MSQQELLVLAGAIFVAPHVNKKFALIVGCIYGVAAVLLEFL